jgi:hypothetical protein
MANLKEVVVVLPMLISMETRTVVVTARERRARTRCANRDSIIDEIQSGVRIINCAAEINDRCLRRVIGGVSNPCPRDNESLVLEAFGMHDRPSQREIQIPDGSR